MAVPAGDDAHASAARTAAAAAVTFAAKGDASGALNALADFLRRPGSHPDQGPGSGELLLTVLFEAAATMVSTLGVFVGSLEPVRIGALDDDSCPVGIDEATPVERTFVRALLAEIYGDRQATLSQIRLAFAASDPRQVSSFVTRTVSGTAALFQACSQYDLPVPDWLAKPS
ncbi:MAG TPA: hypothetical protein VE709_14950 [Pseudonocardiaceae bacterium]|jgi:hypothetical protein|nr:hypothetical protein [Pseudonocardiaceae bacterium]